MTLLAVFVVFFFRFLPERPGRPDSGSDVPENQRNSQNQLFSQHPDLQPDPLVQTDRASDAAAGIHDRNQSASREGTERGDGGERGCKPELHFNNQRAEREQQRCLLLRC